MPTCAVFSAAGGSLRCPRSKDWRAAGVVTPVKSQGQCGSCWAFSTVAAVESWVALHGGGLLDLSEQELVDCDPVDHGCVGGDLEDPFRYVSSKKGLLLEASYPYESAAGQCAPPPHQPRFGNVSGCLKIPRGDEEAIRAAVCQKGPVCVGLHAGESFHRYSGGVFDDPQCGTHLNHGVLIVGYGTSEEDGPFWLLKNSWGTHWGEGGYMRMRRAGPGDGVCGINLYAVMPA